MCLRRNIGYVIQSIGLMPHRTIAENIAMVPKLVGWDDARIAERTDEQRRPNDGRITRRQILRPRPERPGQ